MTRSLNYDFTILVKSYVECGTRPAMRDDGGTRRTRNDGVLWRDTL